MNAKTMKVGTMTVVLTSASRSKDFHGRTLRRVFLTLPNVGESGVSFELTSFNGGPVEVYRIQADGLPRYFGNVRNYFPTAEGQAWFRAAWYAGQSSKAAREAFEASCLARAA